MNNLEKIIELLEKKILSDEEKIQLNSLVEGNPEAKKVYDIYNKLDASLKSVHISLDNLRDYILYKNNLEPENRDIISNIPSIEVHLNKCERCTNEFKVLNEEYSELDFFIADKFQAVPAKSKEEISAPILKARTTRTPIYAFASVLVIGIVYLGLFLVSDLTSPANYNLASVSDNSENYVTRGRATNEFQESIKAIEENNFDKAIRHLENDISYNPDDETIFYSHYILGLSYLEKADKNFIGLFKSFNKDYAKNGLENLQLCIEKNTSGKFPDITYNSYFYSAKASIMLDDIESAKNYLKKVIYEKGSKMSEAQRILNELE